MFQDQPGLDTCFGILVAVGETGEEETMLRLTLVFLLAALEAKCGDLQSANLE